MTIDVRLYGNLSRKAPQQNDVFSPSTITLTNKEIETIFDILREFNIEEAEISHISSN